MVITIAVMAILVGLAMPSMFEWVANSRVRTVADTLQNGVRLAQNEALRRNRQVVFSLTNSSSPQTALTASANGKNWSINWVPAALDAATAPTFIEAGVLTTAGAGVQIAGPSAICFNANGRLVTNPSPGVTGANCSIASAPTYDITKTGAERRLRVLVALGGQVRMCDPDKALSRDVPDGCPAP
ncbi:GspH/FimT family pseudopilin [Variovorax sp. PAMC 28711]|uniref:GspH/FimT family pseudopilin n=1 Tax=Variovorax sp. PAMC 28711 TaxID=1795631 RepID=UPI00078B9F67|nr:GspH/FimT family pseudopilin [Variovorax sp. PAMC 28711]AMM24845.1 type II secretion system protein GspH [Variovorax sp. PAMC 28711]